MPAPPCVIAFTGHRTGFDPEAVRRALGRVLDELSERASAAGESLRLCTSVAEGCDTIWVQLARDRGHALDLMLPLAEAEFATDFSLDGWKLAKAEIDHARAHPGRHTVCERATTLPRPECYFELAVKMLSRSRVLVAVSDGSPPRGLGGTASVVALASRRGIPVIVVDATTGAITAPPSLDTAIRPRQSADRLTFS